MKKKYQYQAGNKTIEREFDYIPVRYVIAVLITVLEIAAIIGILIAICLYVPYFYLLCYITTFACIASSFFFGTGILIIGVAAVVERLSLPTAFLNLFLYGASVNANLSSGFGALIVCIAVSVVWAVFYNLLGARVLAKSDVY